MMALSWSSAFDPAFDSIRWSGRE